VRDNYSACPRRAHVGSHEQATRQGPGQGRRGPSTDDPRAHPAVLLASGTEWERAGITGSTVTAMIVRGLIRRDSAGQLWLTNDGRAALDALLAKDG
jgi:hypothetical protein